MNAGTERDMPGDPAGDVELVGPLPAALVTLGQGDQQQGLLIGRSWRRPLIAILRSQGDPKLRQVEKRFKRPRLDPSRPSQPFLFLENFLLGVRKPRQIRAFFSTGRLQTAVRTF